MSRTILGFEKVLLRCILLYVLYNYFIFCQ